REELNALYVALTRARHTVAVSSIEAHRAAPGSWWQRLHGVAVALSAPQSAPQPAPMPEQDLDAAVADSDTGIDTNTNTHSASQHGSFLLPSLPDLPAAPASVRPPEFREPDANATARIGQAMHRLLEWGGRASDAHIAGVQREFLLSPPDARRAAQMARRILAGDGAWAWQPEVVAWQGNEVDLLHAGQAMRLDRLVQRQDAGHEGHWWVLDYKSAHTPAAQPALVAQLLAYRAAVAAIYPAAVVRAAFLTGQGELVEVI
ncbi:MAG: PD-(D/E)XK nuclease family protein, partial [Polaromonas sp.]|nr:PD-(D/E)XK nuclease family protein [Polaromonas sp.]